MSFEKTVLPSGLTVVSERLPGMASATVSVHVAVGSRDETKAEQGISHLLEHMAFKGTASMNARALAEAFDEIGGQNNAYTSNESTVYYAKVMAEDAMLATGILGDILTHSTFEAAELEKEREVVLQEIASYRDQPEEYAGDRFQETAFTGQSLGRSILGTAAHLRDFTRDDLLAYMQRGYAPERIVVSAAGEMEHARLVDTVAIAFADLPPSQTLPRIAAEYTGGDWREEDDLEQVHLLLGLPALSVYDKGYYALQLFNVILGGGISSRLFQEVREVRGLAYHVQSFTACYSDTGTLGIYAATGGHQLGELIDVVAEQLHALTRPVAEAELNRARKQQLSGLAMARESTTALAEWIGRHQLLYGEYRTFPQLKAAIEAVTAEQIAELAARLLTGLPTVAAYGPVSQLESYDAIRHVLRA